MWWMQKTELYSGCWEEVETVENLKTLMLIYKQWSRSLMEAAVHKSSIDKWLLMRGGCLQDMVAQGDSTVILK